MIKLGVNVDHVATLRQARREDEPDPVWAAAIAQGAGADSIVAHLREDRRHMQDDDVYRLKASVQRLNLEMSVVPEIVGIACDLKPFQATLVPERRKEITTEGGLDIITHQGRVTEVVKQLHEKGILVSLFIAPDLAQVEALVASGADCVEFHTGQYAHAWQQGENTDTLKALMCAAREALKAGIRVNAGHGLNYYNVLPICQLPGLEELNIGHAIISRAVWTGLETAVRQMRMLIQGGTHGNK